MGTRSGWRNSESGPPVEAGVTALVQPPSDGLGAPPVTAGEDVGPEIETMQYFGICEVRDRLDHPGRGRHRHHA